MLKFKYMKDLKINNKKRLDGMDDFQSEETKDEKIKKKIKFNGIRDIHIQKKFQNEDFRFKEDNKSTKKPWKKIFFIFIFIFILGIFYGYFFHSATFEIQNKEKDIKFSNNIYKASNFKEKTKDELPFKIIKMVFYFNKDLKSELIEEVKKKAEGKIKIINNTSKVQKLRKETRFVVEDKIYKIFKSVTILPKSFIIRQAFADSPGMEFNLKKGRKMVIPGFKEVNDLKSYKNIIGEIAEDFQGGFVGKKDIPNKHDYQNKKKILIDEINSTLLIKIKKEIPKYYLLNTDGIFKKMKFEIKKIKDQLKLIVKVDVKVVVFDKLDFLSMVSGLDKKEIKDYFITSTAFLKFKLFNKNKIIIENLRNFTFELNGKMRYIKKFNKKKFINLVRNKKQTDLKNLFQNNFNDFKIESSIFPFWFTNIPNKKEDIKIILK